MHENEELFFFLVGELGRWLGVKGLGHQHENLSSGPQHHVKARHGGGHLRPQHWGSGTGVPHGLTGQSV